MKDNSKKSRKEEQNKRDNDWTQIRMWVRNKKVEVVRLFIKTVNEDDKS